MRLRLLPALCLGLLLQSGACRAADDPRFTVMAVDPASEQLGLFLTDDSGEPFKRFEALEAWLGHRGKTLRFAMNAGMYHADFSPVGLLVIDGKERAPLNLREGSGNFFLKPNGVFLLAGGAARVVESGAYPALAQAQAIRLATQSGPLLLQHGAIHPAFNPASTSKLIRNGVGVANGKALFVISEVPVNFYEFALYFRDVLHCQDALYLDGVVSTLHVPGLKRPGIRTELGPLIGVLR